MSKVVTPYRRGRFYGLFLLFFLALIAAACGSSGSGGSTGSSSAPSDFAVAGDTSVAPGDRVTNVIDTDRIYTVDDILAVGFKKNKTYDVTDLPAAVSAIYGFYGADAYNRAEYEVRFYASEDDALNIGVDWANEATGLSAVILKTHQRWDVGITQRRLCRGNDGHHVGRCDGAKYADFVVVGNMILMCSGKTTSESLDNCNALLAEIS